MKKFINFFLPQEFEDIEHSQKSRFLHFSLLLTCGASILLGIQNLDGQSRLDLILFVLAALSLLCVPLNKCGYYIQVAIFLCLMIITAITFSLIVGVGLMDSGMLAYPIFILFSAFFFNTSAAFISAALSITSVFLVLYLEQRGALSMAEWDSQTQAIIMSIMLAATGMIVYLIVSNWRKIIDNLYLTYDKTLQGWAKALELRHKETEGHSRRVTELTVQVSEKLGISVDRLQQIRRGALIHDIGKMGIPDHVLLKPGPLTPEERLLIEEHPMQAVAMLEDIPFLTQALAIPRWHHERWDGSGYPDGLAGEEIPLEARIFAIVDVWDALISDRPYRLAWKKQDAYRYILENAGILFDPKCVEIFAQVVPLPEE